MKTSPELQYPKLKSKYCRNSALKSWIFKNSKVKNQGGTVHINVINIAPLAVFFIDAVLGDFLFKYLKE